MGVESIGELLYACNENRLTLYKGFGEKTQKNVQDSIEFYMRSQGSHLFADTEAYSLAVEKPCVPNSPLTSLISPASFAASKKSSTNWPG